MAAKGTGTPTYEGCASIILDINQLVRAAGGRSAELRQSVTIRGAAQPILMRLSLDRANATGSLLLWYDLHHATVPTGPQSYTVTLVALPCHLGGVRWMFVCPVSGRHAVRLYMPNGIRQVASRYALRLGYACQRETREQRAWRRVHAVNARIQHAGAPLDPLRKPKWMRWRTFRRLCARRSAAEDVLDAQMVRDLVRLRRYLTS